MTTPVPADAQPGEPLRVAWTLGFDDAGTRRPFNAIGVFVRLRGAGRASTIGFATPTAHADGRYDAEVAVPPGGIGAVEIGLRGTTDVLFPLRNDPLVAGGGRGRPSLLLLGPPAALALLLIALAAVRRRRAAPSAVPA